MRHDPSKRSQDQDVLLLIACGYTDVRIADELDILPNQVFESVNRLRIRYRSKNRANMVALAYHKGDLIVP